MTSVGFDLDPHGALQDFAADCAAVQARMRLLERPGPGAGQGAGVVIPDDASAWLEGMSAYGD